MTELVIQICLISLIVAIFMSMVRLIKGPELMDRIMSLDAIAVCVIGILVLESIKRKSPYFIDLILVFSLLNFIGVVAFVYYLNKKEEEE